MLVRLCLLPAAAAGLIVALCMPPAPASGPKPATNSLTLVDVHQPSYRLPVDVTWHDGLIVTANSRSGTISFVDGNSLQVVAEWKVGMTPTAIESAGPFLLLLDQSLHTLQVLRIQRKGVNQVIVQPVATAELPRYPADLAVAADGRSLAITSLWSRMLTLLQLDNSGNVSEQRRISLPFAPRRVLFADARTIITADNFSGELCVVDAVSGNIIRQQSLHGHNIRGLAVNPRTNSLLVTCQTLDSRTFTTYERIFWGVLMQNGLHSLPLATLLRPAAPDSLTTDAKPAADASYGSLDPYQKPEHNGSSSSAPQRYPLGTPSIGSGDPGAMVITRTDTTLLLISGTSQIAFRTASHLPFERLPAGRRPESLCLNPEQTRAFVANRFDDSLTVLDLTGAAPTVTATTSLGPQRQITPEETGERLFHDATVSLDGWFSCHSCHTDGHSNGLLADTFGDEDRGAPKKVLSLLGTGYTAPWAWNGSKTHLEDQIKTSLIISMQSQLPTEQLPIEPLAAYLRTLVPPPSLRFAQQTELPAARLEQAQSLFRSAGCSSCHSGSSYTSASIIDVGIHDEEGTTEFNPPSLRGVSQRGPWFHDGRAERLRDVLESGHHNPDERLTEEQILLLAEFLESL